MLRGSFFEALPAIWTILDGDERHGHFGVLCACNDCLVAKNSLDTELAACIRWKDENGEAKHETETALKRRIAQTMTLDFDCCFSFRDGLIRRASDQLHCSYQLVSS